MIKFKFDIRVNGVKIEKIIEENTYRLDYNNVTEKLLEDDLKYDDVIVALKTITENGMFT